MGAFEFEQSLIIGVGIERRPGLYDCCAQCKATEIGLPWEPQKWPVGVTVPFKPNTQQANIDVCGICRLAMFEDDSPTGINLTAEDIGDDDPLKTGLYLACRDCIEKYRPIVHARMIRNEDIPAETPLSACRGSMIL